MARALLVHARVPLVTSLPTSPQDGQVIDYLADNTNGIVWRFRYRAASASAYKWEFVGGGKLRARNLGTVTITAAVGVFQQIMGITAPLAGEYSIGWGGGMYTDQANAYVIGHVFIGGTDTGVRVGIATPTGQGQQQYTFTYGEEAGTGAFGVAVGAGMAVDYRAARSVSAGTSAVYQSRLNIQPVRVG